MSGDWSKASARLPADIDRTTSLESTPSETRQQVTAFIETFVEAADAEGAIVNLSGGIDSTVTATLAVEALGADSVYGLVLPSSLFEGSTAQDAEAIAQLLDIHHETIHLQPLLSQMDELVPEQLAFHGNPIVRGNLVARTRMLFAYLAANTMNRLVVGTTNLSERYLGYFTKYGDGAADLLPIAHLYKTQVRALARELDTPEFVLEKSPTAGFWPGQSDTEDIGEPYEIIDAVLHLYVDEGLEPLVIQAELDIEMDAVECILRHYRTTDHKRTLSPTPEGQPGR